MRNFKKSLLSAAISLMTVNANAFPWMSPYAYCFNNPVKFIDPDGRDVHPADSNAFVMLLNTISPDDRGFVVLNENGNVDFATMQSHNSESQNYAELIHISSKNEKIKIIINVIDDNNTIRISF